MLRRNFMSAVGLSGFGSFFGRNAVAPPIAPVDFDKIYRIEEKDDKKSEIKYLKICDTSEEAGVHQIETYLVVDENLTKKYSLIYHNPDGPASITKYYGSKKEDEICSYSWMLNGMRDSAELEKPYLISTSEDFFQAYFHNRKVVVFETKGPQDFRRGELFFLSMSHHVERVNSIEQFESKIGMTIEKLLSFN